MKRGMIGPVTCLLAAGLLSGSAVAGPTAAQKCQAAKDKIAAKYYLCLLKAEAKATLSGDPPDYTTCSAKFDDKWDTAENKVPGACPDTVTTVEMNTYVSAAAAEAAMIVGGIPIPSVQSQPLKTGQTQCDQGNPNVPLGACPGSPAGQDAALSVGVPRGYTDNGDGTITDTKTGLMWEKLSDDSTIHDKDNTYTFYTAFTTKIATLNGSGFAGHADWRLPNRFELETLLDLGRPNPPIDPAFNAGCMASCTVLMCSCMQSFNYWSSTNSQLASANGWVVSFNGGLVITAAKINPYYVRAVRGGS